MAEFFGTLLLVSLGLAVIHQATLGKGATGTFLSVNLGWGFALTLALLLTGRVSGGHLNPAVTIAVALVRGMRWGKACGYIVAQLLGAFSGAALTYLYFYPLIKAYENGPRVVGGEHDTAGLYASYKNPAISTFSAFIGEFLATGVLIIAIFTATDKRNNIPSYCGPFIIGLSAISIGVSLGSVTGGSVNPARDLGPRVFTAIAGWGPSVFTAGNYYFWVPNVAPILGAIVSGTLYEFFIC
ncbi:aquaporin [Basidiobolus meristosporus CBS 931.73]|uniref:Aquaporin n=1 Tax=Basidiobolus meristosporus CBS 931.73 TaxID=1314790 RepID=A0A1Y1ZA05_9FUNG|nr:aquaporin [Basidiobolus meristosporus CBS 931.73]|eukprot:ORY06625.1 aquaporin [Basidiobolus meristosporus CBS 931.73]